MSDINIITANIATSTDHRDDSADIQDSTTTTTNNNNNKHPTFISNNLQQCYEYYVTMLQLTTDDTPDYLLQSFNQHEIQVWMSGLICNTNSNCQKELIYFIASKVPSTTTTSSNSDSSINGNVSFQHISKLSNNNCLPGCGCDNPWPFLSS